MTNVMVVHGIPEHIRSDNGPAFIATRLRNWLTSIGVKDNLYRTGQPWENGYCESFNGTLKNELPSGEIFHGTKKAQALVNQWVRHYNTNRPHSSLGYKPPAPEVRVNTPAQDLHPAMH